MTQPVGSPTANRVRPRFSAVRLGAECLELCQVQVKGQLLALRWRCWGGIKNLEAAAAGIEQLGVNPGSPLSPAMPATF